MKTKLSEINKSIPEVSLVICSSSFERRWFQITKNLSPKSLDLIVILQKSIENPAWKEGITAIKSIHGDIYQALDIEKLSPKHTWIKFVQEIVPLIKKQDNLTLIDITTFTHETVAFFTSMIKLYKLESKVRFAYAGASSYMTSNEERDWWLSRGVKDIRSILGFPGVIRPSQGSHLIILVGFEIERAKELIIQYEPSSISLGIGTDAYSQDFFEKNNWYRNQIQSFIETVNTTIKNVSKFEFSCSDPISAKNSILAEANKFNNFNITLAPMNTKVSTIAAASAALENEDLKLCYVEPLEYNRTYYSTPGDTLTLIHL
ncbi:hypothetical protein ADINL_0084 [Nitrincola lacisaponensis]|uniref:Uncharacterized protein n=1 Tax=Nitrincola lacisaponensis TaxID=267850 RepID=A0A063Y6T7_9GAMM|nr:hypothetical protein [Nitrincola lacisaponensis]KDE41404.1 hypothetical protein ADINL_0084 [Nitrincola lacisaponensis]